MCAPQHPTERLHRLLLLLGVAPAGAAIRRRVRAHVGRAARAHRRGRSNGLQAVGLSAGRADRRSVGRWFVGWSGSRPDGRSTSPLHIQPIPPFPPDEGPIADSLPRTNFGTVQTKSWQGLAKFGLGWGGFDRNWGGFHPNRALSGLVQAGLDEMGGGLDDVGSHRPNLCRT